MPTNTGPIHWRIERARLLAEGGVGLVADDDRVGVRDLPGVAHEPLVGLDGHRAAGGRLAVPSFRSGGRDALLVAAVAQLAEELVDEVAAVGEDQDAAGARGLDEAERGDGLAGAGGVLEPEAARGAGVLVRGVGGGLLLGLLGRIPVERLLVGQLVALDLDLAGVQLLARPACRPLPLRPIRSSDLERDQRAGQGVHLVGRQRRAVGEVRLLLGEQPLEARGSASTRAATRATARCGPPSISAQRRVERGAARRCPPRARARRPLLRARRVRARIPRRASVHRRKPARLRPRSFFQPR